MTTQALIAFLSEKPHAIPENSQARAFQMRYDPVKGGFNIMVSGEHGVRNRTMLCGPYTVADGQSMVDHLDQLINEAVEDAKVEAKPRHIRMLAETGRFGVSGSRLG